MSASAHIPIRYMYSHTQNASLSLMALRILLCLAPFHTDCSVIIYRMPTKLRTFGVPVA